MTMPAATVGGLLETTPAISVGSVVLHVLHYALLIAGFVGTAVLLLASGPASRPRRDRSAGEAHETRVAALRAAAREGRLGHSPGGALALLDPPVAPAQPPARGRGSQPRALPIAVVSTAAAAGVHAAAGPSHLSAGPLVAAFFVVAALAQLGWAGSVLLGACGVVTLRCGAALNAGLALVWLVSRTTGLPVVATAVEPVGAWDLAATAWQGVAVLGCLVALRTRPRGDEVGTPLPRPALAEPAGWPPAARAWLAASAATLLALGFLGAPR